MAKNNVSFLLVHNFWHLEKGMRSHGPSQLPSTSTAESPIQAALKWGQLYLVVPVPFSREQGRRKELSR